MGRLDEPATALARLDEFVNRIGIPRTLDWFDRELGPTLGIDVFDHPFDPATGHAVIETPSVRLLILRQESLAHAALALSDFLELDREVEIESANVGSTKDYAEQYATVLDEARFDALTLDRAYQSRYASHFYAAEELAALRQRWSASSPP
jgi:hypothetical protein